jgi:hypothetical protein
VNREKRSRPSDRVAVDVAAATGAVAVTAATFVVDDGAAEEIQPVNRVAITITYKAFMVILLLCLTAGVSGLVGEPASETKKAPHRDGGSSAALTTKSASIMKSGHGRSMSGRSTRDRRAA